MQCTVLWDRSYSVQLFKNIELEKIRVPTPSADLVGRLFDFYIGPQQEGGHKLLPKLKRIFHGGEGEDKPTEKLKEVCAERKIAVREVKLGPVF